MRLVEDPELTAAANEFARGVPLPLVQYHFEILDRCSAPPEDWNEQLDRFAESPSLEGWRDLMRFVPEDLFYQRHRNSIRYLRKRGVDPNVLFACACHPGMTSDAIALVEDGLVRVETILARADAAGRARGAYVGLAAQAAYLAGDLVGTIRLLREAMASETEWISAVPHVWFIRQRASESEHEALDRAGIPREPE